MNAHDWTTATPNVEGWYAVRHAGGDRVDYEGRIERQGRGLNFRAANGHHAVQFRDLAPVEWRYLGPTAPVEPLTILRTKRARASAAPAVEGF